MSKIITRKYIQRITKHEGNTSIRQSSGGGGGGGGGVSQYWVDDNYISKEFFNRVFAILDENGDAIEPNDTETVIDKVSLPSDMAVGGDMSVTGEVRVSTGVLSNGYVTALSDIRKKNVVSFVDVDIEQIAKMPVFNFTWKEGKQGTYLGTSAQEIQKLFPAAVSTMKDGYLAMDYGATALAAAVLTARKVVNHEERIRQLETENEKLRKLLNIA
jgi:hypothetical protein